jgi:hypothetical protein
MIIKDRDDWIELAAKTLPKLPDYAATFDCGWSNTLAMSYFEAGNMRALHGLFQMLWADLPDSPDIRFHPFFDLCDLCSEDWALEDGR